MFVSLISAGASEKLPGWEQTHTKTVAWSYDTVGKAEKCVEKKCELANKQTEHLYKVSSPCLDDHQITVSRKRNLNQLENCQKYAHNLSCNACTWHALAHK